MPARLRQPLLGYLLAVLMELLAVSVTVLLIALFSPFNFRAILMISCVVVIALGWGAGPGLWATLVGTFLIDYALIPPTFSWAPANPADVLGLGFYAVVGVSFSLLVSRTERARRQTEALAQHLAEAQAKSESDYRHLRSVLEVLPVGVFIADATGRLLETNPACQSIWGEAAPLVHSSAEYGAYQGWWPGTQERVAPGDWALARALKGEVTLQEEIDIQTFDGQRKTILNHAVPMRDATGAIAGGVVAILDISERKRLEAALRQAEQAAAERAGELEAIFEALTDGLLVYDAEGRILRQNRAASQLLGFEAQPQFASLPWHERAVRYAPRDAQGQPVLPEDLALSRLLRGEVLTGAQTATDCLQTPDGREVEFSMTGTPLRNAEGGIIGAVAIVRDETQRRRLERQVAEHAAQLDTIFESIADKVFVTDRQGRVLHMNQAYRTLLGLEQDPTGWMFPQLEAAAGFSGYTPAGQPLIEVEDPITRVLRGEVLTNEQSVDILLRTRTGREVLLNLLGSPIRDATGQVLGSVLVGRDVTEQRRLEQQTREALEALLAMAEALVQGGEQAGRDVQASEQALQSGADPALTVVARRLAELTQRVLNCRFVAIAALDSATEVLTPITAVGLTPADEQQWWAKWTEQPSLDQHLPASAVAALHAGETVLPEHLPSSFSWWQRVPAARSAVLVPMRVGETLVGLLRVDGDSLGEEEPASDRQALIRAVARLGALVLERERLLRERAEAQAQTLALEEATRQMESFVGVVSHELKNPLTTVRLGVQLAQNRLRREGPRGESGASMEGVPDSLAQVDQQVQFMDRLLNDLVESTRLRAGMMELRLAQTDLATIVGQAVEQQRQAHPTRLLTFPRPPEHPVPVWADADRLRQVVTNYLTNALKYSPADQPVEVGLEVDQQQGRVWVRDEGPGLPPEEQARIWERFHRAKGIEVQSGTGVGLGLGLHICRTIVEQHHGQVGVESAPDQGSTFWFTLPLSSQG